eukprot:jgi/Ulvmu1/8835/UM049_0015.1
MVTTAAEGALRLAGGQTAEDGSSETGRLEIFEGGGWSSVCRNFLQGSSIAVACSTLGYDGGIMLPSQELSDSTTAARIPLQTPSFDCPTDATTIAQCASDVREVPYALTSCNANTAVAVICYNQATSDLTGQMRLVGGSTGPSYEYGRLEIFIRGFWSNVCSTSRFTPAAAQVACTALGFSDGAALRFIQPYANTMNPVLYEDVPVALAGVDCTGNETSLSDCVHFDEFIPDCINRTASTVLACSTSDPECANVTASGEGAVRLRGGFGGPCDSMHTGLVEIMHLEEWGGVCVPASSNNPDSNLVDNLVADVVCRQLGFPHGTRIDPLNPTPRQQNDYDPYEDVEESQTPVEQFWLQGVQCTGPEARLDQCDLRDGFDRFSCSRDQVSSALHVVCRQFPVVEALEAAPSPDAEDGELRLFNRTVTGSWVTGMLQVFLDGSWTQVCRGRFGGNDTAVACRQLGYGGGTVVPMAFERDQAPFTVAPQVGITALGCEGEETRLLDCGNDNGSPRDFERQCMEAGNAGLQLACVIAEEEGFKGDLRLVGELEGDRPGSATGVLEIFYSGAWGSICMAAETARGDYIEYYDYPDFFFSRKRSDPTEDTFTTGAAVVACQQLGFVTGVFRNMRPDEAPAPTPPWLSSLRCSGDEFELLDCDRSDFGDTEFCGARQQLYCSSNSGFMDARLAGGSSDPMGLWAYGRLEVLYNDFWSAIVDQAGDERIDGSRSRSEPESLGHTGVQVACRSLGYTSGAQMLAGRHSALPSLTHDFVEIRGFTCNGTEDSLGQCDIAQVVTDNSGYDDTQVIADGTVNVALMCSTPSGCNETSSGPPAEGDVRLVPLPGTTVPTVSCDAVHAGAVELFHAEQWGSICSDTLATATEDVALNAQIVCKQLGFPFGTVMDTGEVPATATARLSSGDLELVWGTEVICTGQEERLIDCQFTENFASVGFGRRSDFYYDGPEEDMGVRANCGVGGNDQRFAVVCRMFPIEESQVIRR